MRPFSLRSGLLAAVLLLTPVMLRAETLLIRNETNAPLTLQAACVVNGMVRPQRPVLVQPGAFTRVSLPGNKLISVYDSRLPNRTLFQGTLEASPQDQAFAIIADGNTGQVKLEPVRPNGGSVPGQRPGMPGPQMPGPRPGNPPGPGTPPAPGNPGRPKR